MKHAIRSSLLASALVSAAAISANAAPVTPSAAPVESRSQAKKVHETHYVRRTYVYRRSYRPSVEVYEEREPAYGHQVYRYIERVEPDIYAYEDDDDDGPDTHVSVDLPFFSWDADGPRRFHRHGDRRSRLHVDW